MVLLWFCGLVPLLSFLWAIPPVASDCVMRGLCHQYDTKTFGPCALNNATYTSPIDFDPKHPVFGNLSARCPHLFADGNTKTCCTYRQAETMLDSFNSAYQLLGRCPSCFDNFAKLWCEFTCSPEQSRFVEILNTRLIEESAPVKEEATDEYVVHVRYNLSQKFAEGAFKSCEQVSSGDAIGLMCSGSKGAQCSASKWLKFLGTQNLKIGVPLQIDFNFFSDNDSNQTDIVSLLGESGFMSMPFSRCDQSPRAGLDFCSPDDCNNGKPITFDTPAEPNCTRFGYACSSINLFAITVFVSMFIFLVIVDNICKRRKRETERYQGVASGSVSHVRITGKWIEKKLQESCEQYGAFAARYPYHIIAIGLGVLAFCSLGFVYHETSNDLKDMWSSPEYKGYAQQSYFDKAFKPFHRVEQVIFYTTDEPNEDMKLPGPIFRREIFEKMFELLKLIRGLSANVSTEKTADNSKKTWRTVTLDDLCYRPLGSQFDCLIMSPTNYFQNDITLLNIPEPDANLISTKPPPSNDDFDYYEEEEHIGRGNQSGYLYHLEECIKNPLEINTKVGLSCLGTYGGPIYPKLALGQKRGDSNKYSNVMTMTFTLLNTEDGAKKSEVWEKKFVELMRNYSTGLQNVHVSYMAERSIQDDFEAQANYDVITIIILLVFVALYVCAQLSHFTVYENKLLSCLVHTKLMVGFLGILISCASGMCTIGLFSYLGAKPIKLSLVILFFIVVGLGINRSFMLVYTYQSLRVTLLKQSVPEKMSRIVGQTMPSVLVGVVTCSFCFFSASFTAMPALKCFARFAAVALLLDIFFQCTIFLGILTLDMQREETGWTEVIYGLKPVDEEKMNDPPREIRSHIFDFFEQYYAPFLLKRPVRILVIIFFFIIFIVSLLGTIRVRVGFDQTMAVSSRGHLRQHWKYLDQFMDIGPPVYFVVRGAIDMSNHTIQNKFCTFAGCSGEGFGRILNAATKNSSTWLEGTVFNWVDTYLEWVSRDSQCCMVHTKKPADFCSTINRTSESHCTPCMAYDTVANSANPLSVAYKRPSPEKFRDYLSFFKNDVPNFKCVKGGKAAFQDAILTTSWGKVEAFHFMTFHRKLRMSNSTEFIEAMEGAGKVARALEASIDGAAEVFAYSPFYVFYEQYTTLSVDLSSQLLVSLCAVFVSLCVMLGNDVWNTVYAVLTIVCGVINMLGIMYLWNIELNAISATIMVMSLGVYLEFVVHILRAYCYSTKHDRIDRAQDALASIGPIIFAGQTVTMFGAVFFLAFAHAPIIQIYFFRLFLSSVVIGAMNAMILLPVLLASRGPCGETRREVVYAGDDDQPRNSSKLVTFRDRSIASVNENVILASAEPSPISDCARLDA